MSSIRLLLLPRCPPSLGWVGPGLRHAHLVRASGRRDWGIYIYSNACYSAYRTTGCQEGRSPSVARPARVAGVAGREREGGDSGIGGALHRAAMLCSESLVLCTLALHPATDRDAETTLYARTNIRTDETLRAAGDALMWRVGPLQRVRHSFVVGKKKGKRKIPKTREGARDEDGE